MLTKMQAYFGFTTLPFSRGLAIGQLFRSAAHNEAVARITYAVHTRALAILTGEVGAGKTVAVRAALAGLDGSRHHLTYLPNPTIGARGIHTAIVTALGGTPRFHHATLVPQTAEALATEVAERGRTPVLVIDEAHLLGHDQLEAIRMLTNSELDSASPLACLLLGQPRLRHNMKLAVLAALDQRITIRYTLNPMTPTETSQYLRHHTKLAGFSELRSGHGVSGGGRCPVVCRTALIRRLMPRLSMLVRASRRLTGRPSPRLAARRSICSSPLEHGRWP